MFGQGFYKLHDINLMEQEMIHYLLWDLTIPGPDLTVFADCTKANYEYPRHLMLSSLTRAATRIHLGKVSLRRGRQLHQSPYQQRNPRQYPYRYLPYPLLSTPISPLRAIPTILHHI